MTTPTGIRRYPAILAVAAILAMTAWSASYAATICGTVRDANTMQPVANAAVFLFDDLDQYTGIHAGTDLAGYYCLENVSPGTYTVQVRRDDYETVVVEDVVVDDIGTGIDVVAYATVVFRPPSPNPARDRVNFDYSAPVGADIIIEIYDIKGRLVRGWQGPATGPARLTWDFTDLNGHNVASGVYMVRLVAGDVQLTRRLVRFR